MRLCRRTAPRGSKVDLARAFTLTELLVVLLVTGLIVLVLAPALQAAAGRSRTQVCLANLRSLGIAIRTYAEEHDGILPGPLHPGAHHGMLRDDDDPLYQFYRESQLAWRLRVALGDSITDRLITCPVMAGINPDQNFSDFYDLTGRRVYPVHYGLNNVGATTPQGGPVYNLRTTNPPYYFGWAHWSPTSPSGSPVKVGQVNRPADEWMIADAWYRPRTNPAFPELQQEGPYQFDWTGEALPNFAPHQRRDLHDYSFTSTADRNARSSQIRQRKAYAVTNTLFFDGHAAGVRSKTLYCGEWELLYGFPGTVNPNTPLPPGCVWE